EDERGDSGAAAAVEHRLLIERALELTHIWSLMLMRESEIGEVAYAPIDDED
ncbi:hypothetical protein HAX54_033692, partial [Datura stramonium]|nr:hypothetical protein [Datura stramonium]